MKWAILIAVMVAGLAGLACAQQNGPAPRTTLVGGHGALNDIAYFSDGTRLIGAGNDSTVRIWNLADGAVAKAFDIAGEVNALALAPDGSMFAALVHEREIYLIDIAAGKLVHRYTGAEPEAMMFSPDSKSLIIAIRGGQVRSLDLATRQSRDLFQSALDVVNGMTMSADGKLLALAGSPRAAARGARGARSGRRGLGGLAAPAATASAPGRIAVFDISQGLDRAEQYVEFPVLLAAGRSPAFSPDGKLIAAIGTKTNVWSMADGSPQWGFDSRGNQLCIAFSPNSRLAAIGGGDLGLAVVLAETGRPVQSYPNLTASQVRAIRFAPDGKSFAAIRGEDVAIYDVPE